MTNLRKLSVGWLEDARCADGGCWALFLSNGHLFMTAAQKGRHERTRRNLAELAHAYNQQLRV